MLITEKQVRLNTKAERDLYQFATGQSAQPSSKEEFLGRMQRAADDMIATGEPELELLARVFISGDLEASKG